MMSQQVKKTDAKFPAGIRVLVVDDDQTCLLWIENLLHTCQFKATTTLYAREAIEMLRQDKNKYDLVITDVQMPDIDGFQLLETIGLEMDLPVIMMSIYNDKKFVKKGVEHGAVDYLLKPVRLEEIQNIWQHVLRRRNKEKKTANPEKNGLGSTSCRRRRNSADYEDDDDSGREKEEHTSHKRPRVVWTPELHRKFVAAVNHLGIDKAVPKKILDVMDVEILTRENVASHLQKYRMYLKKVNSQQNIIERNSFEAMNYLASTHPNSLLSGYPPSLTGILGGRLNNSISSSDLIQSGQNLRNSISPHAKLQPNGVASNLLQGMVGGFEQDQTQAGRILGHRGDYNSVLGVSENFVDPKVMMNGSKFSQTGHSPDCWKSAAQNNPQSSFQLAGTFTQNQHQMNNNVFESLMAISGGGGVLGAVGMDQNNLVANGEDSIHGTKPQQIISKRSDSFIPEEEFIPSNIESMDDIVNFMTRRDNNGSTSMFIDGEFNFDAYGPASAL